MHWLTFFSATGDINNILFALMEEKYELGITLVAQLKPMRKFIILNRIMNLYAFSILRQNDFSYRLPITKLIQHFLPIIWEQNMNKICYHKGYKILPLENSLQIKFTIATSRSLKLGDIQPTLLAVFHAHVIIEISFVSKRLY